MSIEPGQTVNPDPLARQRALVERHPQNELARFSLGKALFDRGSPAEALDHFQVALERKPDWMAVRILAGRCHLALGSPASARQEFERGLELAELQGHEGPKEELQQLLLELKSP